MKGGIHPNNTPHPTPHTLKSPIPPNQTRCISGQSPKNPHTTKIAQWSSNPVVTKFTPQSQARISMQNSQRQKSTQEVVESLPVAAVEFSDDEENEGKRDTVEEIGLAADGNLERVGGEFEGEICSGGFGLWIGLLEGWNLE